MGSLVTDTDHSSVIEMSERGVVEIEGGVGVKIEEGVAVKEEVVEQGVSNIDLCICSVSEESERTIGGIRVKMREERILNLS